MNFMKIIASDIARNTRCIHYIIAHDALFLLILYNYYARGLIILQWMVLSYWATIINLPGVWYRHNKGRVCNPPQSSSRLTARQSANVSAWPNFSLWAISDMGLRGVPVPGSRMMR